MPSPFPGMNPYLESPENWHGFHSRYVPALDVLLNQSLPAGFASYIEERIYVVPEEFVIPDVITTRPLGNEAHTRGTAVMDRASDDPEVVSYYPDRIKELFIEVRRTGSRKGEVVTTIELLSPSNKQSGGKGRQEYQTKQSDLLESGTHLLEIDLLRAGAHTVSVPRHVALTKGPWDYLVCLHRAGQLNRFEIWRNSLQERLPNVKVPLTPEHADISLNLQEALNNVYDTGPYRRDMDYRSEPDPPLTDEQKTWADQLLREQGFRS